MPKFDNIIVLDNGAVAEQGTHAELLKKKGIYYKMWSAQAEKYTSVWRKEKLEMFKRENEHGGIIGIWLQNQIRKNDLI